MIPGMNFGQQAQNFKQPLIPGSQAHQASFHQKGPDYEIKLFVGGLAFQTLGKNLELNELSLLLDFIQFKTLKLVS